MVSMWLAIRSCFNADPRTNASYSKEAMNRKFEDLVPCAFVNNFLLRVFVNFLLVSISISVSVAHFGVYQPLSWLLLSCCSGLVLELAVILRIPCSYCVLWLGTRESLAEWSRKACEAKAKSIYVIL